VVQVSGSEFFDDFAIDFEMGDGLVNEEDPTAALLHLIFTTSQGYQAPHPSERRAPQHLQSQRVIFVDMADRLSADEVSHDYLIADKLVQSSGTWFFALSLSLQSHLEEK